MSDVFGLVAVGFWTLAEGRLGEASATAREVLVRRPGSADAMRLLAAVAEAEGDFGAAAAGARRAALIEPLSAPRRNLLGRTLFAAGRVAEAERAFQSALALSPGEPLAVGNLGVALLGLDRPAEAEPWLRRASALAPADPEACLNLGNLLRETDRPDEAARAFRQALALRPAYAEAWSNLGGLLRELARPVAALASHRRAVRLAPAHPVLRYNRALALLETGRYGEGWREYEARWEVIASPRVWPGARWDGGPCAGRTLLLHAEQGFGDTLQMLRYAPLVAALGARAIVEVPPALVRLARGMPGLAGVIGQGDPLPAYDAHAPLMSLPHLCGTTLATVPGATPYLAADAARIAQFAAALGPKRGLRVGLVWAGSPREGLRAGRRMDRVRSLDIADLAPLGGVAGVTFVSLQKGPGAAQAGRAPFPLVDLTGGIKDFADTAALIANLDLVIGCDTSVIHLAGALGGKVWLLHRAHGCWRWLLRRADSPWYPNMRIFRQERPLDWRPVVERVAEALAQTNGAGPPQ